MYNIHGENTIFDHLFVWNKTFKHKKLHQVSGTF